MEQTIYQLDTKKISNSPYIISGYDRDLRITVWNAGSENKFGIKAEDAIGKKVTDLFDNITNDFRLKALRDTMQEQKSFYFPDLPFQYSEGSYSQLIIPTETGALMITAAIEEGKSVSRNNLLSAVIA